MNAQDVIKELDATWHNESTEAEQSEACDMDLTFKYIIRTYFTNQIVHNRIEEIADKLPRLIEVCASPEGRKSLADSIIVRASQPVGIISTPGQIH